VKSERDGINPAVKPSGTGCVECSASGGWWLHLRRCAQCGHIGCCDSSPNQHASKHYAAAGHPPPRAGVSSVVVVVAELADMMLGVELDTELGDQIKLRFEEVDMMLLVAHQLLEQVA
jgi:Zn-finger in ubiquitin-hydrolases and other protein